MKYRRRRKKTKSVKGKRLPAILISLFSVVAVFAAVMGINGLFFTEDGYEDIENEALTPIDKETGKINVLVCGLDESKTRTDTILIASYDLDEDKVNILSIPRDTRMYVGGNYQKINCAYAISKNGKMKGINGTIEAVSRLTEIPLNYYVVFSCDAFCETIDALGGVDFDVPRNMNYDDPVQNLHIHLNKGMQHLDGDKSEQLVRFRKYPMGDIDRVKVQQDFIKALAEQKLNMTIISKLPDIFKVLNENINTNFTISDVTKYALNIADLKSENIFAYSLPGMSDSVSYGSSYWVPDMTELATMIEETFGYDASKITIHSADGSSISKDVKLNKEKAKNTENSENTKDTQKTQNTKKETDKADNKQSSGKSTVKEENNNQKEQIKTSDVKKEEVSDSKNEPEPEKNDKKTEEKTIKRPAANPVDE